MPYMSQQCVAELIEIQKLEDIGNGNHRVILRDGSVASFQPDGTVVAVGTDAMDQSVKVTKRDEESFDSWPEGFEGGTLIGGSRRGRLWLYRLP